MMELSVGNEKTETLKMFHDKFKDPRTMREKMILKTIKSELIKRGEMSEGKMSDIDALRRQGMSAKAIAKELGLDPESVKKILMRESRVDEKQIKGLKNKSEKTNIPYGILKQVYNRGMAAWKTGHRPGAGQQQWAFARVNSFITGGGARKADADLWKKVKASRKKKKKK